MPELVEQIVTFKVLRSFALRNDAAPVVSAIVIGRVLECRGECWAPCC